MDRPAGEKDGGKTVSINCSLKIPVVAWKTLILVLILFLFTGAVLHAEDKEEEKKITIEKTDVIGVLEKPAVIFPVRWKSPEGQPAKALTPERSFKKEIFELVDMDAIRQEGLQR